jgi:hypothetical protein
MLFWMRCLIELLSVCYFCSSSLVTNTTQEILCDWIEHTA